MKKTLAAVTVACALYSTTLTHPLQITSPVTKSLFRFLSQYDEKYSKFVFRVLTQFTILNNSSSGSGSGVDLKGKILMAGFDHSGACLRGLQLIGLGGVEIGPVSKNPSQTDGNLGALHTKSNIYAFLEQFHSDPDNPELDHKLKNDRIGSFKIGVCLEPDREILEYAPYLIHENMVKAVNILTHYYDQLPSPQEQAKDSQGKEPSLQVQTPIPPQIVNKKNNSIDFITIDSDKIHSQLGPQAKKQTDLLLQNLKNYLIIDIATGQNIAIYEKYQNGHKKVYIPGLDRSGLGVYGSGNGNGYSFVTWKDVITEIIGEKV